MADYSKLSTEDLIKLKNGDYAGMSTEGLTLLKGNKAEVDKKGIDLTPSGIINNVSGGIASVAMAPYTAIKEGINPIEATKRNWGKVQKTIDERGKTFDDKVTDFVVYNALPATRIAKFGKLGNAALTGAYQGGVIGALEGLKEEGNINRALSDAGFGAVLPVALNKIAQPAKELVKNPKFQKGFSKVAEILTSVPEEYTQRALAKEMAGQSILKGKFDAKTAYRPIETKLREAKSKLPTFEKDYRELGLKTLGNIKAYEKQLGEAVSKATETLSKSPENIEPLKQAVRTVINKSAKGGDINPYLESAGKEIGTVLDYLRMGDPAKISKVDEQLYNDFYNKITKNKLAKLDKNNFYQTNKGKHGFHRRAAEPMSIALEDASRETNKIIDEIAKDPNNISARIKDFEQRMERALVHVPTEAQSYYYEPFYNAISAADDFNKAKLNVKPIDLHNAKDLLYDKIDYNNPNAVTKNEALKSIANQIDNYLDLKNPTYAANNQNFADLKELQGLSGTLSPATIENKLRNWGSGTIKDDALSRINELMPENLRFASDATNLAAREAEIKNILDVLGNKSFEKNPRLLSNRTDEAMETALDKLQNKSGINFMNELNDIRAREALENLLPGQGGGSGSMQGLGNLVRGGLITLTKGAAAPFFSPKLFTKGSIQNMGNLQNNDFIYPNLYKYLVAPYEVAND